MLAERAETRRLVLLLFENELTGKAPTLLIFGIITVFDEAQGSAQIIDDMSTYGSNDCATVVFAFNFQPLAHEE